ncbi:MAG: GGDEF domain-containing protein [Clostridiales bacterium]|nr:GGDEF domain-containing protein [Clostridiales bacterium]
MNLTNIRKLTVVINSIILFLVFGLAGFFFLCGAEFLVWFSIPTALVYIFGYYLIKKDRLDIYIRLVYSWLTLYMCVTTVFLGYQMGFHLYCLSMVPIIFYTEYMAQSLGKKKINALAVSAVIVLFYMAATGYSAYSGPIYEVDSSIAMVFWLFNSAIVFYFLIVYARIMLKLVGDSEKKLTDIAHTDRLTGLYNRHFMMTRLEDSVNGKVDEDRSVAMADIDNFKGINDSYGHNAGDYVLKTISDLMRNICKDAEISRWGGEEFLLFFEGDSAAKALDRMEELRRKISEYDFTFEGVKITVTITIGIACYEKGLSVDEWIKEADERLYFGKNNGKNRVVSIPVRDLSGK